MNKVIDKHEIINNYCRTCQSKFLAKEKLIFCSDICESFYKKNRRSSRLCIGAGCRGEKYFMSDGAFNRICNKCKMLADYRP